MPVLKQPTPFLPAEHVHSRKHLYQQVRETLAGMIEHSFADGEPFYSEKHLVDTLSVSQITVRRALQELEAAGFLERSQGRRAVVRRPAQPCQTLPRKESVRAPLRSASVRTQRQVRQVGIFVPQISQVNSEYGMEMVSNLYAECEAQGLQTRIYDASSADVITREFSGIVSSPEEEAFVLFTHGDNTLLLHHALANRGFRTVAMEGAPNNYPGFVVETDARAAIQIGVSHLSALGHTRITLLANEPTMERSVEEKLSAFEQFTHAAGIADTCAVVDCGGGHGRSFDCAYEHIGAVLSAEAPPTAVLTLSDPGAWAVLRWCAQNGLRVPADVSVLGFEDARSSKYLHPALSSVAHPLQRLAEEVINVVTHPALTLEARRIEIAPVLVPRESTGPVPGESRF